MIQRRLNDTKLNQARSKPNIVYRPARIFVQHYNSTQYCNKETVFLTFPFLTTNIMSHDVAKWRSSPSSSSNFFINKVVMRNSITRMWIFLLSGFGI